MALNFQIVLGENIVCKNSFEVYTCRDGPKKVWRQGRDETRKMTTLLQNSGRKERQGDYTLHVADVGWSPYLSFPPLFRSKVDILRVFIPALFPHLLQVHHYTEKPFPLVSVLF